MKKLKGFQRKYLRGLANTLDPVVFVGKQGVTDAIIDAVDEAMDARELVKIRFVEFKKERKELAAVIEERTHSEMVGMIGHVAIFYREQPDEDKRSIALPTESRGG
ncbi:MAG: YhbY family RNA-binding protein [Candidatus Hydrogenedentes bacterium]|nr:YhbY family RNA-binding protein [Candidatus Hydrogenedentota bacterium]